MRPSKRALENDARREDKLESHLETMRTIFYTVWTALTVGFGICMHAAATGKPIAFLGVLLFTAALICYAAQTIGGPHGK